MVSRRSLLALAPALTLPASAHALTTANARLGYPPGPPLPYVGLGDVYGAAIGYWGVRAISSVFAAQRRPVLRLQRWSSERTMDICVLPDGMLDTATATDFLSGSAGGVSIWYDQSGNGRHLVQTDPLRQPQLAFAAAGSCSGIGFVASAETFLQNIAGSGDINPPVTFSHCSLPLMAGITNAYYMIFDSVDGGNQAYQFDGFGDFNFWAFFRSNNIVPVANNSLHSVQLRVAAGYEASDLCVDGVSNPATFPFSAQAKVISGPNAIGCDISGPNGPYRNFFNGIIAEMGLFATAATPGQMSLAATNQSGFWGTS